MPLEIPKLDDRNYQQILDETLSRIRVHTPEWTNYSDSDPGATILQLFAFMTESLLYRCNLVPERNRRKFLSLLGIPMQPAAAAEGFVVFSNEGGSPETVTLSPDLEVMAGKTPFRTRDGLDVLQTVRQGRPTQPVIILTARGEEGDRVRGLKLGADDYVVKPFSVQELLARVEAVLRRSPGRPLDLQCVRFPDGVADLERRQVRYDDGSRAELAEREAELLRYLACNSSRPVSRDTSVMASSGQTSRQPPQAWQSSG